MSGPVERPAWAPSGTISTDPFPQGARHQGRGIPCPSLGNRPDCQLHGARGHFDRHAVAGPLANERPTNRGLHRDAPGRRVSFHCADQLVDGPIAFLVLHFDGRTRLDYTVVLVLDDLSETDHLFELPDA